MEATISGGLIGEFQRREGVLDLLAPFAGFLVESLATPSAFSILSYLATHPQLMGHLEVISGEETLVLAVGEGKLWNSQSSEETDNEGLTEVVKEMRLVRHLRLEEVIEEAEEANKSLVRLLFEYNLLDKSQVVRVVSGLHLRRLEKLLNFERGDFYFNGVKNLDEVTTGLSVPFPLIPPLSQRTKNILKDCYTQDLEDHLGGLRNGWLTLAEEAEEALKLFRFEAREEHVLELLRTRSAQLTSFGRASVLGESNAARFLTYLLVFHLVITTDLPPEDPDQKTPLETAKELLVKMQEADLFEQVGGHFTSHSRELAEKMFDLKKLYGPGSPTQEEEGWEEVAVNIWDMASAAWDTISDTDARKEYREKTIAKEKLSTAAALLYRQGQMSVFRGAIEVARRLFETASEIEDNPEYADAAANPMKTRD